MNDSQKPSEFKEVAFGLSLLCAIASTVVTLLAYRRSIFPPPGRYYGHELGPMLLVALVLVIAGGVLALYGRRMIVGVMANVVAAIVLYSVVSLGEM